MCNQISFDLKAASPNNLLGEFYMIFITIKRSIKNKIKYLCLINLLLMELNEYLT